MALTTLTTLSALSPGCDLWIMSDSEISKWTRKIDWYLNFQFQKAEAHSSPVLSMELRKVIETWNMEEPVIQLPVLSPVMIASANLLPNTKTVLIPWPRSDQQSNDQSNDQSSDQSDERMAKKNIQKWAESCRTLWVGLKRPSTRIFLPDSIRTEDFDHIWSKFSLSDEQIEVVSASELLSE